MEEDIKHILKKIIKLTTTLIYIAKTEIKLVEDEAKRRYGSLIKSLSKQEDINEDLKADDPIE